VAIEGAAVGGGAELSLLGHRIFMASDAVFGFLHAGLGVSPGWGGGARLVERVGRRRTVVLLADAARLDAHAAAAAGVVDVVCAPGAAVDAARDWLSARCTLAPEALAAAVAIGQGHADEAERFGALWGGPAHRRALGEPS
jgi:enoyl-CoA hydratase/carnithine racemase